MIGYKATRVDVILSKQRQWLQAGRKKGLIISGFWQCRKMLKAHSCTFHKWCAMNKHRVIAPRWGYGASFQSYAAEDLEMNAPWLGRHCVCVNTTNKRGYFECCNYFPDNLILTCIVHKRKIRVQRNLNKTEQFTAVYIHKSRIEESLKEPEIQHPSEQLTPWGAAICGSFTHLLLFVCVWRSWIIQTCRFHNRIFNDWK